jgi:hypothetical protein
LSKSQKLAESKWLLFLTDGNISSFFADINVPFNCEFLVARHEAMSVTLYEVYRVADGKPLNNVYFGRWTLMSGLGDVPASIYMRRKDLQGTVINAVTVTVSKDNSLLPLTLLTSSGKSRDRSVV